MQIIEKAREIVEFIKKHDDVHIVTHLDADGICAGAIAARTLERLGKDFDISFVKQVDEASIENVLNKNPDVIWFTDLGINIDVDFENIVITDHHTTVRHYRYSLNPNDFGLDGCVALSGAGATYIVSKSMDARNKDLSHLAIIGACGDLQDRRERQLVGLNREILNDAISAGLINVTKDIQYFGRESKPIFRLLLYADDPVIPGVSGSEEACISFLMNLGFSRKEIYRKWVELSKGEKRKILSEIARRLLDKGFGSKSIRRLIGEVYLLNNEKEGTELHDTREFATLLNSTARYGRPDIALKLCLGEKENSFKEARKFLNNHRQTLSTGLQLARAKLEKRKTLNYFHVGSRVRDTVVGSITSILSKEFSSLPLIGFADGENGHVKVSARYRNTGEIDLSRAIYLAALSVGGTGGGHRYAAGALIPKGTEEMFLDALEKELGSQLSSDVL